MPIPNDPSVKRPWESRLSEATARIEQELRAAVDSIDKEVVPELRRHSSTALRALAGKMQLLAEHMDDARARAAGTTEPPAGTTEPPAGTGEPPHPKT